VLGVDNDILSKLPGLSKFNIGRLPASEPMLLVLAADFSGLEVDVYEVVEGETPDVSTKSF
jgi:hypothetical protein